MSPSSFAYQRVYWYRVSRLNQLNQTNVIVEHLCSGSRMIMLFRNCVASHERRVAGHSCSCDVRVKICRYWRVQVRCHAIVADSDVKQLSVSLPEKCYKMLALMPLGIPTTKIDEVVSISNWIGVMVVKILQGKNSGSLSTIPSIGYIVY